MNSEQLTVYFRNSINWRITVQIAEKTLNFRKFVLVWSLAEEAIFNGDGSGDRRRCLTLPTISQEENHMNIT